MANLLKPKTSPQDNYRVTFGSKERVWLEVFTEREAGVCKLTAEAALGPVADVVVERMVYAIFRKEPDGERDKIWDYCFNRSDAMELCGLIWDNTRYNQYQHYWKYVTRESMEDQQAC